MPASSGIRPDLVRAVIQVESAFNPRAVSPKGAMGLMQLMPATAKQFGVIDPFNPAENIRAGVSYLRQLLDRYDHDEQLALAAYNAGPGAVDKYGSKVPPYKETQNYVLKITGIQGNVRHGRPARASIGSRRSWTAARSSNTRIPSPPAATSSKSADSAKISVFHGPPRQGRRATHVSIERISFGYSRIRAEGAPAEPGAPRAQPQVSVRSSAARSSRFARHRREGQGSARRKS